MAPDKFDVMEDPRVLDGTRRKPPVEARRTFDNIAIRPLFRDEKLARRMLAVDLTLGDGRPMALDEDGVFHGVETVRGELDCPRTPLGEALDSRILEERERTVAGLVDEPSTEDAVIEAVQHGDVVAVRELLPKLREERFQQEQRDDWDALTWAAHLGHETLLLELLAAGVFDPNHHDRKTGWSPLMWAAHNNNVALAHALVQAGADVNQPNRYGATALHWAAEQGRVKVARFLLEHGARVSEQSTEGNSPLTLAARAGHCDMVRLLVAHGARDHGNYDSETGLMGAVLGGHRTLVELLLDLDAAGVDVLARNQAGQDAAEIAASWITTGESPFRDIAAILEARKAQVVEERRREEYLRQRATVQDKRLQRKARAREFAKRRLTGRGSG